MRNVILLVVIFIISAFLAMTFGSKLASKDDSLTNNFDKVSKYSQDRNDKLNEFKENLNNKKTITNNNENNMIKKATIRTNKGEIKVELYESKTPKTVANFVKLASDGVYDGVYFHRVIPDFMIQTGDPQAKGTPGEDFIYEPDGSDKHIAGTGGPGYTIEDEFDSTLRHDGPGILSMANTGSPNTGGSQFFITHVATPWLDDKHSVFGRVTEGQDVVDAIVQGDKIEQILFE